MNKSILAAAEVIGNGAGQPFLRYMSDAYFGKARGDAKGDAGQAGATAEKIGLIRTNGATVKCTRSGRLVGNVAKEYCTFVDHGRRTASPKPSWDMISAKDVLDIGCSFGRTLWEFQSEARSAVGIEPQEEFIVLGRALSALEKKSPPKIIAGVAENLDRHFGPESLDLIFSRLALSYVSVMPVLEKMISALRGAGHLWIEVDSPRILPRRFLDRTNSWRRRGWLLLAMLNLPVCILTGRQISVGAGKGTPYRHRPVFLPLWWWRKTLQGYGLKNFRVYPGPSLTFSAQR